MAKQIKVGYVHDEFKYAYTLKEAYPYTHPKAYFAETESIHGTIHHMPKALKCDKLPFRPDFDYSPYDLIIFFLQGGRCETDVRYMTKIKEKHPDILLIWWWGEIYRLDHNPELWWEHILKMESELVKIVDVMASPFHVYETIMAPIYKRRFGKPYRTIFEPYDTHHIRKYHIKTEYDISRGIWTVIHGRNPDISRSLQVMERLQRNHSDLLCYVSVYRNKSKEELLKQQRQVAPSLRFEWFEPIESHDEFLDVLKTFFFIFDDYPAYCGSNLSCCSACCGVPTISHDLNTSGSLCFPNLTFGFDDLGAWTKGAERLIKDEGFYKEVMRTAQEMAEKYYSYKAVNERIIDIWKEFKC